MSHSSWITRWLLSVIHWSPSSPSTAWVNHSPSLGISVSPNPTSARCLAGWNSNRPTREYTTRLTRLGGVSFFDHGDDMINTDVGKEMDQEVPQAFCLGSYPDKCATCQHQKNWDTLNQMPDALRLAMQKNMIHIRDDACRLTKLSYHKPVD